MYLNIKKYLIFSLIGLIFSGITSYYLFRNAIINETINTPIWDYIPSNFQTLYYLKINSDLINILDEFNRLTPDNNLQNIFLDIEEIALVDSGYKYLIIKTKNEKSITNALQAGIFASGANYKYQALDKNYYIYGEDKAIQNWEKNKNNSLNLNNLDPTYLTDIINNKYNFLLIKNLHDNKTIDIDPRLSEYLTQLKYSIFLINISKNEYQGKIDILVNKDLQIGKNIKFSPKLIKYNNINDYFFLEINNLVQLLDINIPMLKNYLELISKDYSSKMSFFTTQDYENILQVLNGNISLVISKANNLFNIGFALILENNQIFTTIQKFLPFLKENIATYTSSDNIRYSETNNNININFLIPYGSGKIETDINFQKTPDNLIISFFNPVLEPNKSINYSPSTNSLLYFYLNIQQILDLYQKVSLISAQENPYINKYMDFLKDKRIIGQLIWYNHKFSIEFTHAN